MKILELLKKEIEALNLNQFEDFETGFNGVIKAWKEKQSELRKQKYILSLEQKKKELRKICPGGKVYYTGTATELLGKSLAIEKVTSKNVFCCLTGNRWSIPLRDISLIPDNPERVRTQRRMNQLFQ